MPELSLLLMWSLVPSAQGDCPENIVRKTVKALFEVYGYIALFFRHFLQFCGWLFASVNNLTHCILVDTSTVICWTSTYVILGCWVYVVAFVLFLLENSASKQSRP